MRGLTQEEFASHLKESFVSIWVDDESGFGTFPLESMACGTPVIGKVPNMKPSWMSDQNGIWTYDFNKIVDILAEFIQNWLEDNISDTLYSAGISTASNFQNQELFDIRVTSLFNSYLETRRETFVEQLEKIKLEENTTDGK
jgi:glycosyltransferase involved in cell wall biosynthesis